MSVLCELDVSPKSQDQFNIIDRLMTGFAFDIHNDVGRFCNEKIYQNIILEKCSQNSINADSEVPVTLHHNGFSKTYRLDIFFIYLLLKDH